MSSLDRLIPGPRLLEIDRIDLSAPAATVWQLVRHGALDQSRVRPRAVCSADDNQQLDHGQLDVASNPDR